MKDSRLILRTFYEEAVDISTFRWTVLGSVREQFTYLLTDNVVLNSSLDVCASDDVYSDSARLYGFDISNGMCKHNSCCV